MNKIHKIALTIGIIVTLVSFSNTQDISLSFQNYDEVAGTIEVYMENSENVYGFQFNVTGLDVTSASGGSAGAAGFMQYVGSESLLLGVSFTGASIPAGEGVLTVLATSGATADEACFDNIVVSGQGGAGLSSEGDCLSLAPPDPQPDNTLGLSDNGDGSYDVTYVSTDDIYGIQFYSIPSGIITEVCCGASDEAGFMLSTNGTMVIGFSFTGGFIPAGSGTLVVLTADNAVTGLESLIMSGVGGSNLDFDFWDGGGGEPPPCDDLDADGICDDEDDCVGEYDECGDCNGDGIDEGACDCDGNVEDECGECGGDGSSCSSQPSNTLGLSNNGDGTYNVTYVTDTPIFGLQFDGVPSGAITAVAGGAAEAAGFMLSSNGTMVIGFSFTGGSIPVGNGTLVVLTADGLTGLASLIISGDNGVDLGFTYWEGDEPPPAPACLTIESSNLSGDQLSVSMSITGFQDGDHYHAYVDGDLVDMFSDDSFTLTVDCDGGDHSLAVVAANADHTEYSDDCSSDTDGFTSFTSDCAGECDGSAVVDECGECGGDGSDDLGCGCFEPGPSGCDNECGSDLEFDACGVCGGDGSNDLGCGCFEPGPSGCDNECGSDLEFDACGVCGGDGSNDLGCGCFEPGPSGCDNECGSDLVDDQCGECGGDGTSCLGCTDSDALNYDPDALFDDGTCTYPNPFVDEDGDEDGDGFLDDMNYNQSQLQAFYLFFEVNVDGIELEDSSWIGAYRDVDGDGWGDLLVGAAQYGIEIFEGDGFPSWFTIPVMGNDGTGFTDGYMEDGEAPRFKVWEVSTGLFYDAITEVPAVDWSNIHILTTLDVIEDCNTILGGHAYLDDCEDCVGGSTGLVEDYNDPDGDDVCNDGASNGDDDNCPNDANADQWNYDGDPEGDACDSDDDNDGAFDDNDWADNNENSCSDTDIDTCDDCSSGTYDICNDGPDYDGDCICDNVDDCVGEYDECGDCNGDGIDEGACDCDGNVEDDCGICDGDGSSCSAYIESSVTTSVDESELEDMEEFSDNFEAFIETALSLPAETVDVTNITLLSRDDIEVTVDFTITLTEEELAETDFGSSDDIADALDDVEGDVESGGMEFIEGCTNPEANNYNPDATIDDGSCETSTTVDYNIDMHAGANLISLWAFPEDNSVSGIMADLGDNATGVIGEGEAASHLGGGTWIGSLSELSPTSGYWVKVNGSDVLNISDATPTNPETVYNLHTGANLISFPFGGSIDLSEGIPDDVEPSFIGVIGEGEAASQIAPYTWIGSLSSWSGTKGYWAKVSEAISFSFNAPTLVRERGNTLPESPYDYTQSIYQAFYFIEEATLDGESLEIGDWIIAYNNDIVVGARQWTGAYTDIPAMGFFDESTLGYCEAGDIPRFVVEKGLTGEVYELDGTIPVWENNMLFYMTLQGSTVHVPTEFEVSVAYPNPFNPRTTIKYGLPADNFVSVVVYDLSGKQVASLMNEQQTAGFHSVTWDAQNHSSGLYFVKLVTQDYQNTQKVMLVK